MTEGFLSRWSRLKRETETPEPPPRGETDLSSAPADADSPHRTSSLPEEEGLTEPVDPASLPPVESLGADSDYTRFLAPGVPEELKLLALRKAWSCDPAIAEFRGFAEYDWDCNAPGYGQLLPTDDVKALVDAVFGDRPEPPPAEEIEEEAPAETAVAAADPAETDDETVDRTDREHDGETSGA